LLTQAADRIESLERELAALKQPSSQPKKGSKAHGFARTPVNGTYGGHVPAGAEKVTVNPLTWPARMPKGKGKVPSTLEYAVDDIDRYIVLIVRKATKDADWMRVSHELAARRRLGIMQIRGVLAEARKRGAR
jgi:hypothetical protein